MPRIYLATNWSVSVSHRTSHNIIAVWLSMSAFCDEVKPFICHFNEFFHVECCVRSIFVDAYDMGIAFRNGLSLSLFFDVCTIESEPEILVVTCHSDLKCYHLVGYMRSAAAYHSTP